MKRFVSLALVLVMALTCLVAFSSCKSMEEKIIGTYELKSFSGKVVFDGGEMDLDQEDFFDSLVIEFKEEGKAVLTYKMGDEEEKEDATWEWDDEKEVIKLTTTEGDTTETWECTWEDGKLTVTMSEDMEGYKMTITLGLEKVEE